MRLSNSFFYSTKNAPKDAVIISHQLMLKANLITQTASGIYCWLPLGLRVLNKVSNIIKREHEAAGVIEILMSTIQISDLWMESGRYNAYGDELLRFKDRKDHELLYGPTNEEQVSDIFRKFVKSYKELPKILYHVQWKFRDELRPRFGVMRGREFLMKDAYSFDLDMDNATVSYNKMFNLYVKIFRKLGFSPLAVQADSGAIGGDMSHEFHVIAESGESKLFYDKNIDFNKDEDIRNLYAVSEEKYNPDTCPLKKNQLLESRGIEVGHIFYFGDKYTKSMNISVMDQNSKPITPVMGSYGIGVSRLVGALVEVYHDEYGICWPEDVAPYKYAILNLMQKNDECCSISEKIYDICKNKGIDILYDDRYLSPGFKLKDIDLIGIPYQIIISENNIKSNCVEWKERKSGKINKLSLEELYEFFNK